MLGTNAAAGGRQQVVGGSHLLGLRALDREAFHKTTRPFSFRISVHEFCCPFCLSCQVVACCVLLVAFPDLFQGHTLFGSAMTNPTTLLPCGPQVGLQRSNSLVPGHPLLPPTGCPWTTAACLPPHPTLLCPMLLSPLPPKTVQAALWPMPQGSDPTCNLSLGHHYHIAVRPPVHLCATC